MDPSNNPIQTPKSLQAPESPQGFVAYSLNPLFNPIVISPQHPYSPYDWPGIPLELSPRTYRVSAHKLFPSMELEGEIPVSSLGHLEVSTTHTPHMDDEQGYEFPPKGFPYTGKFSSLSYTEASGPMLPHGYTTLV